MRSSPRPIRWATLCGILLLVVAAGLYGWKRLHKAPPPQPPIVQTQGVDPQIVAELERSRGAILKAPFSGQAWGTYGAVLMVHRYHREALDCLAHAEALQPQEPRWPWLEGIIRLNYNPDEALPKLARGAELSPPQLIAPRLKLANLLLERGKLDEAQKYLSAASQVEPENPRVLLGLGKLALLREKPSDAVGFLQKSAAHPEISRESETLLATVQQRLGNADASAKAAAAAAASRPDAGLPDPYLQETSALLAGKEAWLDRANELLRAGQVAPALEILKKTTAAYPDSEPAWRMLGWGELLAKDYAEAERAYQKAVKIAPESDEAWFQLGNAVSMQNRRTEATRYFRKAIGLAPDNAPAHYNLGSCLAELGQPEEAIKELREAVRNKPDFAEAWKRLGGTLALGKRYEEAVAPLQKAVALNPKDENAAKMLELAKVRAGEKGRTDARAGATPSQKRP